MLHLRGKQGSPFTSSIYPLQRNQLFWDDNLVGSKCHRHYFSGIPLSTLQPLAPLLLNATWSTWLSAIYSYTDYVKQTVDITQRCVGNRKQTPDKGVFSAPSLNASPLWYVLLLPPVTHWLLHNLLLTHIFSVSRNKNSFSAHRALGGSISNNLNITHLPRTWVLWLHARHLQETEMQLLPEGKNCVWGAMVQPEAVPGSGDGRYYGTLFLCTQQISVSVQRLFINCPADTYCNISPLSKSTCLFLSGLRTPISFPWE